ncbi:hypothetical protein BCR39DRAFT_463559 [Naematelia encephala]|uniref:P-loop containing nucleoside triphosphate hydrolase protein n=1 Tax=Naematelia encephala TaxID=71784 RepID=A0A1Y2BF18_9TREE|nr:hypothetical protein BCR39DRAFT_463559 [Naematelia encephala]
MRRRLVIIGIGGASCSGKTLLAKHVRSVLPSGSTILHQDDFAPPIDQVPYSKKYGVQDWDDPPTCILWDEFRATLKYIRIHGTLPNLHTSHDHLNKQVELELDPMVKEAWRIEFQRFNAEMNGEGVEVVWFIVDGFVLYWDQQDVVDKLDIRIFLQVPHDLLKRRREERQVYVLQNPDDAAAGGVWSDPPNYFEEIVYPAYIKAHEHLFDNVETGQLKERWTDRLQVVRPREGAEEMTRVFGESCKGIIEACRQGKGTFL